MTFLNLVVRKAVREDLANIKNFNQKMALETEGIYLEEETLASGIKALFDNSDRGFYLVSENPEFGALGTLAITFEWSDWRNGMFWWIQSVYVKKEARRQEVFTQMYKEVKFLAKKDPSACGVRLYVEKTNLTAQRTYAQLGMKETHYQMWEESFDPT